MKLYTVPEVADLLRCKPATIYNLVKADQIPHLRIGKLIRFDADAIEDWIRGASPAS
jgi:excisionase family DNA binding protein